MDIARSTPQGSHQSGHGASSGEAEAPRDQQRDGLRTLLRGLSFLQAEQALKPPGAEPPPPPGDKKKLPATTLERLLALVPAALTGVDEGGAKVPEAPGAPAPAPKAPDPQAAERQEAAQAEALLSEGEPDEELLVPEGDAAPGTMAAAEVPAPEVFAEVSAAPEVAEPEVAEPEAPAPEAPAPAAPAPVQAKGKAPAKAAKAPAAKATPKPAAKAPAKAAKAPAKAAAKHAAPAKAAGKAPAAPSAKHGAKIAAPAKKAPGHAKSALKAGAAPKAPVPAPDPNLPLDAVHARAAFRWTKKQGFAAVPFIIRRYQRVLGIPANGVLTWDFVQAVARFQRAHGMKPVNGKLAGKTAKGVRFILRRDYGLDKKNLLTSLEVKMAQKKNVAAIHDKKNPLSWKVVRELRELLHLPPEGGLTPNFLRAIAAFQLKHHLGRSAYLSAGTIKSMRNELGSDLNKKILNAALAYRGTSTAAGPGGGNVACAWAVNNILQRAIGHKIGSNTNLVASVESALPAYGHRVSSDKAKGGDIVICPTHHIGIATSSSTALSNSSSRAAFVWESDLTFDGFYGVGTHIWRITKA